eukprot:snap_masked-scaffold_19-processed-gene-6.42-mRNA-1 protein AED:1.00 eAED:1.00 QI:0/-1/0/0/-1/1/1/0/443
MRQKFINKTFPSLSSSSSSNFHFVKSSRTNFLSFICPFFAFLLIYILSVNFLAKNEIFYVGYRKDFVSLGDVKLEQRFVGEGVYLVELTGICGKNRYKKYFLSNGLGYLDEFNEAGDLGESKLHLVKTENVYRLFWNKIDIKEKIDSYQCTLEASMRKEYHSLGSSLTDYVPVLFSHKMSFIAGIKRRITLSNGEPLPRQMFDDWLVESPKGLKLQSSCSSNLDGWLEEEKVETVAFYFIGSSQVFYECDWFKKHLPKGKRHVIDCEKTKGPLQNHVPEFEARINEVFKEIKKAPNTVNYVFINFAGLWDVAYGKFYAEKETYKMTMKSLLSLFLSKVKNLPDIDIRLNYLLTTIVNPDEYKGIENDTSKYFMTQPRVDLLNLFSRSVLEEREFSAINLVDTAGASWVGLHDPKSPGDMRHFGSETNKQLVDFILCQGGVYNT